MGQPNLLIYLLRRDLRLDDNPVFHDIISSSKHGFTHLLPVYVFAAQQIEVSGFIPANSAAKSPYPEARSPVGNFWRCGPHRARFLCESVWDLKENLQGVASDLDVRVGMVGEVVTNLIDGFSSSGKFKVGGVWMTSEEGVEEKREEKDVRRACEGSSVDFKLFGDEKYFIDDRDVPFQKPKDLPDVFTTYRKMVEPLREAPRPVLPTPERLLPLPDADAIPPQHQPFSIPNNLDDVQAALLRPIALSTILPSPPPHVDTPSAHPFTGGSGPARRRVQHLIASGAMTSYKATRNGLLGTDFSTKLSGWLALGCITARQVHHSLLAFENGQSSPQEWSRVDGYGQGENDGTKAVRFELLWRDYMRLCTRKFGPKLFRTSGFREDKSMTWRYISDPDVREIFERFLNGTTGMGLIDASQRELFLTGYTSNRARQNVASFLAKHLNLDWRLGAEWYESMLVDYDVSSNWGNWQYVAGVGNDPRGEARIFNPVKQGWDYDGKGEYVLGWVRELAVADAGLADQGGLKVAEILQAWEVPQGDRRRDAGLDGVQWVEQPLKRIIFTVGKKQPGRNSRQNNGGPGRAGPGFRNGSDRTGGEKGMGRSGGYTASRGGGGGGAGYGRAGYGSGGGGGYNGRGYGNGNANGGGRRGWSAPQSNGYQNGQNGNGYSNGHGGRGGGTGGGGRQFRSGMMEKAGMPGGGDGEM